MRMVVVAAVAGVVWVLGTSAQLAGQGGAVTFKDVTAAAGISFTHNSGRAGKKYLPETMGAGGAFADLDGDGWLDIVLVNGRNWTPGGPPSVHGLYRNNRDGTFTDVAKGSGLDQPAYGMGVAAGDVDNDGDEDLYITALEGDRLYRNDGAFTFANITKAAGIVNANFGTSAAFVDYDRDGRLDVFAANYVKWSQATDKRCALDGKNKSYCTPEVYPGVASKLFRNLGNSRFADVSQKAGIANPSAKALGVGLLDYDLDGWVDLFVANDTQPNQLFRNNGNGTFTDTAVAGGVAFSDDGVARGAMGVDAVDYDRSGRPHVLVSNFQNQMLALYRNDGGGLFTDVAPSSPVGRVSMATLGFGTFFFDYDLDGWQDVLAANGHIEESVTAVQPKVTFKQPPLLFRNTGKGRFEHASASVGADFAVPQAGRGAAHGDYDRDGDLDVLFVNNHAPARLLRNDGGNRHHWVTVRLAGTKANRSGIGAIVRVQSAGGSQWQMVRSGSSYCSQSDLAVTFGLGTDTAVTSIEVEWPGGAKERVANVPAKSFVKIVEGRGWVK
jgi:enediyne biosynthesis protein E4